MADVTLPDSVKGTVTGRFTKPNGAGVVSPRTGWVDIYPNVLNEGQRITISSLEYAITASHKRLQIDPATGSIPTSGFLASVVPGMVPQYLQWVCETHFDDHGGDFIAYFDVPLGGTVDLSKVVDATPRPGPLGRPLIQLPTWTDQYYPGKKVGDLVQALDTLIIWQVTSL